MDTSADMPPDVALQFEDTMQSLEDSHESDAPRPKPPLPENRPKDEFVLPLGTQPLLDAQLGEALKIMRDYAAWVHDPNSDMRHCTQVGDALARLMVASATLAGVAARLQSGDPESRHRIIVEHAPRARREGEGSTKPQNE